MDVDKMFLRIPAFEEVTNEDGTKSLQKIEYNLDNLIQGEEWRATSQGSMTKRQRDNMMIDIEYAILTSVEGSEQVYKPGNADIAKKWGKVSVIINDNNLRRQFIIKYGHLIGINTKDYEEVERQDNANTILSIIHHKTTEGNTVKDTISLKDLQDFLDNGQTINVLLPQTYAYMHDKIMGGASLVGLYANGASMHTKMQETYLSIDDEHSFYIKGFTDDFRKIQSLHDQTTEVDGKIIYIQEQIAQLQAASVDNAKDPILSDLHQKGYTAGIALMMLRAGMSMEELSYFFGVYKSIENAGLPLRNKFVGNLRSHVIRRFGKLNKNMHVTVEEVINTNLYIQKYPELIAGYFNTISSNKEEGKDLDPELEEFLAEYGTEKNLSREEMDNILKSVYNTYSILMNIINLKSDLKPANDIMKCDSTNNAISVSIPNAILQRFEVDRVKAIMGSKHFPFIGNEDNPVVDEFIMNNVVTNINTREEMEANFMSRRLPHIQAFYSLGIELPLGMMKDYLIQGNSELQENLFKLLRDAPEVAFNRTPSGGFVCARIVNCYFREFMQYLLSMTEEFGDSDNESFDVKRMYYLEVFPKKFIKLKKEGYSAISNSYTLSSITITRPKDENTNKAPQLILPKNSSPTPRMKADIRRDLNMLLYDKDPEVHKLGINLFKYSLYNNGFNWGPNSFGSYFDSVYWNTVPRVINLLRTFKHDGTNISKVLDNFTEMFIANHANAGNYLLMNYLKGWPMNVNEDGTVTVDRSKVYSLLSNGSRKHILIASATSPDTYIPYVLVKDSYEEKTATYKPMPVFDDPKPVYNANSTAEEMMSIYFNDRKAKAQAKLDAIKAEEDKKKDTPSITNTDNTSEVDESPSQVDAAERQSSTITEAVKKRNEAEEQEMNKNAGGIEDAFSRLNDAIGESYSSDPSVIEEIVNAEAQFMEMVSNNTPIIEGIVNSRTTNLSEEQFKRLETIAKESKEAYDKINKCNIK